MANTPLKLNAVYTFSPITETIAGAVKFVGNAVTTSGDSSSYGGSPSRPYATLDYGITQAGVNGTVYVLPGHAENIASASPSIDKSRSVSTTKSSISMRCSCGFCWSVVTFHFS